MPAVKINKFLGLAPKAASELLANSAAQIAYNFHLDSGDIVPYRTPTSLGVKLRTNGVKTIYGLHDPNSSAIRWLSWDVDVDVVQAATAGVREGRFYYVGDGKPKVSNYELASRTNSTAPSVSYELGLPLPDTTLTTAVTPFSNVASVSRARDSANIATVITASSHGLRTGHIVSITGFPVGTPSAATFNATNATITVIDATTFTYYSPGEVVSTTADSSGTVALAGNTIPRSYVYTWYTPWDEESIASSPSADDFIKEGQNVTVNNIPNAPPVGDNHIRAVRLHRTLATPSGTAYFRLSTLWFPTSTARVSRENNVSTVTLAHEHKLLVGDKFKLSGCTDSSFNITDGIVTGSIDAYTFTYTQANTDVADTSDITGTLYHNVAETRDDPARYWGDGGYSFLDDFDYRGLVSILNTDDNDPPPADLRGLVSAQNGLLAGFSGNKLYFAEPSKPHAWPIRYAISFDARIVALSVTSGYIVVLTDKFPYLVSGGSPQSIAVSRTDVLYPCLAKASVVNMPYGVVYATHGGLAVINVSGGIDLVTKYVHDWDTWPIAVRPSELVGEMCDGKYFGSDGHTTFLFERDEKVGGYLVNTTVVFDAAWCDPITNILYYSRGVSGELWTWDTGNSYLPMEWKSKTIVSPAFLNLGAARIVGDFIDTTSPEDDPNDILNENLQVWTLYDELGTMNGPIGPYMVGTDWGCFNTIEVNGDPFTRTYTIPDEEGAAVLFRLWRNKELIFQREVRSSRMFRLPTGYRTDTFEVGFAGAVRVRAVHLGETVAGLKAV